MSATIQTLVDLTDPGEVAAEISRINLMVSRQAEVPDQAWKLVDDIASSLDDLAVARWQAIDPYLLAVFLRGFAEVTGAMARRGTVDARRRLRLGLERMRHALEEIAETAPISDERPAKEVVRWLYRTVPVPQQELASILGVDRRKLQRWLNERPKPEGNDALRVAAVARIVNQLRHSLTPVGVVHWFNRPRPELGGKRPRSLLADVGRLPQLVSLAASVRHSDAV